MQGKGLKLNNNKLLPRALLARSPIQAVCSRLRREEGCPIEV